MKCAIIHDSLLEFGGAERVLKLQLKLFPNAHIFTAAADPKIIEKILPKTGSHTIYTSPLSKFCLYKGSLMQLLSPFIFQSFFLKNYKLIISNSAYLLSNYIRTEGNTHIQYFHGIPKNLYNLTPKNRLQKILPYDVFIKIFHKKAIHSSPYILSNSKYLQQILLNKFKISSEVIYPPVHVPLSLKKKHRLDYFVCVCRLSRIKYIELAINACNILKLPLKIAGDSIDKEYKKQLKALAGPTIEFLGNVPDEKLGVLLSSAKGFIMTSKNEDFGIAPVEAMAYGTPVIAFWGGGLKETVIPGVTGLFYKEHSVGTLVKVLKKFDPENFDPLAIHTHAKKFSEKRFIAEFKNYVENIVNQKII